MRVLVLVVVIAVASLIFYWFSQMRSSPSEEGPEIKTVRFGMLPYGDHSYAIIGIKKGWFKEAGINLEYQVIKVDEAIAFLKNRSLDVASGSPGLCFAAYETNPGIGVFAFGSIFQGWGIMAQPTGNYKSYDEFVTAGMLPGEAIKAVISQLKGKVFAYPSEAAVKPFIDLILEKGELSRADFKSLTLDDTLTVNAMRNKQADFQVGGAPSRLILQREGFMPILTSKDFAVAAKPSPESRELAVLFPDGWMTTSEYYKENHDLVLRLASVNFRILEFMNDYQEESLQLHMPYLSQITGQIFTLEDGRIIYNDLDPFYSFKSQKEWFHNPDSVYYFRNLNGSILQSFVSQGIYSQNQPTVDDVVYAAAVYYELEQLRQQSKELLARIEESGVIKDSEELEIKYNEAQRKYAAYNFLDSLSIASAIIKAAGVEK